MPDRGTDGRLASTVAFLAGKIEEMVLAPAAEDGQEAGPSAKRTGRDRKGQVDEAIACCQKAIELDPKDASAHNNLGAARAGKGQVDEAIPCYRKAIEFDPNLAEAHNNLC